MGPLSELDFQISIRDPQPIAIEAFIDLRTHFLPDGRLQSPPADDVKFSSVPGARNGFPFDKPGGERGTFVRTDIGSAIESSADIENHHRISFDPDRFGSSGWNLAHSADPDVPSHHGATIFKQV
jgi:hypothetical protein